MARRQPTTPQGGVDLTQQATGVTPQYAARATAYLKGKQLRQGSRPTATLPKSEMPVAGGAAPSIPHLNREVPPEAMPMPMSEHANGDKASLRAAGRAAAESVLGMSAARPAAVAEPAHTSKLADIDLRPTDMLPTSAQTDPQFRAGTGAMVASSQPDMARKYGVMRDGNFVHPQQLELRPVGSSQQLNPETVAGLSAIAAAQASPGVVSASPVTGTADTATTGNSKGTGKGSVPEKEDKELEEELSKINDFQLQKLKEAMSQNALNNPEQKRIIESRLESLSISDMITKGYVEQRIPIKLDGSFTIILRSTTGEVDIELKRMVMQAAQTLDVSDQYWLDMYSYYSVVASLHGINQRIYPTYTDSNGDFNEDLFKAKFREVLKLPLHILASVGANGVWFEARARNLCTAEEMGNG